MGSLFPDPTIQEQQKMCRYASFFAYRMARPGTDKKALAEDLEMAGWENLYERYESPVPWQRISTAMKNGVSLWECGVTYHGRQTYESRELRLPVAYEDWAAEAIDRSQSIERHAMLREMVVQLISAIEGSRSSQLEDALKALWLENGQRVAPDTLEKCGFELSINLSRRRQVLRQLAQQVVEITAPADLCFI